MDRLPDRFRGDLIPPGAVVVCAVSGGADSICLLHMLNLLRQDPARPFTLAAAHFNHQLRGSESDRDEAFVQSFVEEHCGALLLPDGRQLPPVSFFRGSGDVSAEAARRRTGTEEAARFLRYRFLMDTAAQLTALAAPHVPVYIATAHTANDNLETMLLHFLRGSGLTGLTGISPVRGLLLRPMLELTREDVIAWLEAHHLPHVEDSSNQTGDYLRNRVRQQAVPVLEQLAPGITQRSRDTLRYLREDEAYLQSQAEALISPNAAFRQDGSLAIPAQVLTQAPRPVAIRAVRTLLSRLTGGSTHFSSSHLESVWKAAASPDPGAAVSLPHGITVRRAYETLLLSVSPQSGPEAESSGSSSRSSSEFSAVSKTALGSGADLSQAPFPMELHMGENVWRDWLIEMREDVCPHKAYRSPSEFYLKPGPLSPRTRREGDSLQLGPRPRKRIKKLLIDEKVPRALREEIPVLDRGGKAAALAGFGPDKLFLAEPGTVALHITITRKGD